MAGKIAPSISVSSRQREILERIISRRKMDHQYVIRAKLILMAADGFSINHISEKLSLHRNRVRSWRKRWSEASELLSEVEAQGDEKQLLQTILNIFSDKAREGRPLTYDAKVVCQIIAVACEDPQECGVALSHWTPLALRDEVIKRAIVEDISVRQVGRFLKRSRSETASGALLGNSSYP